jgi:hypothetical protein
MSSSKNTIRFSDISSAPIKLKYSSSYYSQSLDDVGITINRGFNHPMTVTGSLDNNALNYELIKQLYYKEYISGSLLATGSGYDSQWQSTAASGSGDEDARYFPTSPNSQISFFYIPRNEFGEQVARNTLHLLPLNQDSTNYHIVDDGNGNLIDALVGNRKVGNIFYAQGIIVFTDPDYVCIFQDPTFDFFIQAILPSPSPTPSVSLTPFLTPSVTPSVTPTRTPSVSITPTRTPTVTPSISITPSVTVSVSITPSITTTPTVTPTTTPSTSPGTIPSVTPSISVSITPTISITPTRTPSISNTPTPTPTISVTPILGNTIGTYYDPCFIQSSGFPVANKDNVFFGLSGGVSVTDVASGIYLYQSYNVLFTNITAIANSSGQIFAVSGGQVGSQISTC